MNKLIAFFISIAICTTVLEAKPKKANKVREFVKGVTALTAAGGLAYLAYKAPLNSIKAECTKIKNQLNNATMVDEIFQSVHSSMLSMGNFIESIIYGEKIDQTKIFSLITILPAWELAKYGICRIACSIQEPEEICYKKVKRNLKKKRKLFED